MDAVIGQHLWTAEGSAEIRDMIERQKSLRARVFEYVGALANIDHRLDQAQARLDQRPGSMSELHDHLSNHPAEFVPAYNFAKRRKP